MKSINRRAFLKSSALAAPAVAATVQSLSAARSPAAPPAGSGETFRLTREIPVEEGYDLVVAGGGPAGTAAAICAARLGAKVLLVEATGCLGGMGTNAYVSNWFSLFDGRQSVIGGLFRELVEGLCRTGEVSPEALEKFPKGLVIGSRRIQSRGPQDVVGQALSRCGR